MGDTLIPTFQNFFNYCNEFHERNSIFYEDYYEKFRGYPEILKSVVQNVFIKLKLIFISLEKIKKKMDSLEFCRVLLEYKGLSPKTIYSNVRIYILCFPNNQSLQQFIRKLTTYFILSLNSAECSTIQDIECGRTFEVYYDRADFKDIPHVFSFRILLNSLAFYKYHSDTRKNCLIAGIDYNSIQNCNLIHGNYIDIADIVQYPNVSCCLFFNRTWADETITLEYICSTKSSIEICIFEIRVIHKEINSKCLEIQGKNNERTNLTYTEIIEEFLSEDEKIKENVNMEPRERGNLKFCDEIYYD